MLEKFTSNTETYTIYWQPGCTSCLRAKEFLTANGIDYESVNVREDESAMDRIALLGARSIPVITRGQEFAFAQDIDVLADFVGVEINREMLPPDVLAERIDKIMEAAQRYLRQLPESVLTVSLPGRDRTYLDLAFHVFMIPLAFLDAARGGELTFEHFERVPQGDENSVKGVINFGEQIQQEFETWWDTVKKDKLPLNVLTYYGRHSTHSVLERTAWHTAQHVRQLMQLLINAGIEPDGRLDDALLDGLPLPAEVYDDEISLDSQ